MSVNSRLEAILIIGQRRAFYRQRIPEKSCKKKSCNLSEQRADLSQEKGSGISGANSDKHLPIEKT